MIFSLAGQVSHLDSMDDPQTDLEINCRSQLSLLECCRERNPRASGSSSPARARSTDARATCRSTSSIRSRPVDVNGINKLAAEMYYTLYQQVHGMRTVSLRLTNTYGPRMDLRSDRKGFVGVFLRKALAGRDDPRLRQRASSGATSTTSTTWSRRCCSPARAPTSSGQVLQPRPSPVRTACSSSSRCWPGDLAFDWELVPFPPDAAAIDIGDYYGDFAAFAKTTGWEPRVDLAEGLERTVRWFREAERGAGRG